jgi:HEPN domain-containing protein
MTTTPPDIQAMAFLNGARQYQKAASRLLDSVQSETEEGNLVPLRDPIYFLFFHTVELALKAVLRFHGETVPRGHNIVELHRRCHALGLRLKGDPYDLQNVVSLLASGNDDHGFRYWSLSSGAIPDLSWTRDVVNSLIQVVRKQVDDGAPPGPDVKAAYIIFGKPSPLDAGREPR